MATDQNPEIEVSSGEEEISHENGETAERLDRVEENQAMLQLLSDPDIQAVVSARRSGKKIKVVEDEFKTPEEEPSALDLTEGLDEDDPAKKILSRIESLVSKTVDSKLKRFDSLLPRLENVESVAGSVQKKEVTSQIQAARSEFPDFDQYKKQMLEVSKTNPGLNVQELYAMAKLRSGKLKLKESRPDSERPTFQPRRESTKKPNQPARPPGKRGFHELLQESLGGLELTE